MKILLPLLFLFCSNLHGQDFTSIDQLDKRSVKLFQEAQRSINAQQWSKAVGFLDDLLEREPRAIDALLFRAGVQYDSGNYPAAENDFESALQLSSTYAPIGFYRLAVTEYKQEKYTEAVGNFETFLSSIATDDRYKDRAERYLNKAQIGAQLKANPVPFEPQSLGKNINTSGKEYLPSFTADGELLIYTVNYDGQEDFYFSQKDKNGEWTLGQALTDVNTPANEGAQTISADGQTLVFTGCLRKDGLGSCDLYFTEKKDGKWGEVIHPGAPLNTPYWESQPSLSANGKWLFFTSGRPGGLGNNDIWVSQRKENGQWGKPFNLGAPINTPGNDEAPFIHQDDQTLYFMSDGHPGLGGYDLFLTRLESGRYTQPQNLGYPINTSASEGALVVSLDGKTAYYTTDTHTVAGQRKNFDIYQFPLHDQAQPQAVTYVKGQVVDDLTNKPIPNTNISVKNDEGEKTLATVKTDDEGNFLIVLPAGKNYQFLAKETGYIFFTERFELKDVRDSQDPFELFIKLHPIAAHPVAGQEIILKNVLFDSNSDKLLEVSSEELNQLVQLLQENPELHIRINGHTDNIGQEKDNISLSERRAHVVKQFLIDASILEERINTKGFGESQPIAPNDTEIGRSQNRRTTFEIIEN